MIQHPYHREQIDLLMLFTSAFDDSFVYRYNQNTNEPASKIQVRYIHGPKQRVIHDIVSKEKNLTLPVVSIEQTGLTRDPSRVVNKHQNIYRPMVNTDSRVGKLPTPIPVNMGVKISIIAKFKEDVDQIIQNFVTYCNPYFVVSWKVPDEFQFDFTDEIRVQIEWDGNVSYTTPTTLSKDDKYRITADANFTIKGWIFPPTTQPTGVIYVVDTKFISADLSKRISVYDSYSSLSASYTESETVSISAYPEFTNLFYSASGDNVMLREPINIKRYLKNSFLIFGKRFDYNNTWYLSTGSTSIFGNYKEIVTAKGATISAYQLPDDYVSVHSDNIATIQLPVSSLSATGGFTFVTSNSAGWTYWPFNINII